MQVQDALSCYTLGFTLDVKGCVSGTAHTSHMTQRELRRAFLMTRKRWPTTAAQSVSTYHLRLYHPLSEPKGVCVWCVGVCEHKFTLGDAWDMCAKKQVLFLRRKTIPNKSILQYITKIGIYTTQ